MIFRLSELTCTIGHIAVAIGTAIVLIAAIPMIIGLWIEYLGTKLYDRSK
jgi:hypothetical protein